MASPLTPVAQFRQNLGKLQRAPLKAIVWLRRSPVQHQAFAERGKAVSWARLALALPRAPDSPLGIIRAKDSVTYDCTAAPPPTNTLPDDGELLELVVPPSPLASPELWNDLHQAYEQSLVPLFSIAAKRGLELVAPDRNAEVIDVACGPGTLTMQLAALVRRVVAVDFAPSMIELLEDKCRLLRVGNIAAQVADGTALPFGEGRFDAAFSCFGLFLFADRAAGFSELWRVVKPGAKVMVSSWSPAEGPIEDMYRIVRELLPDLPFQKGRAPLGTKVELLEEMTQAKFETIYVESIQIPFMFDSVEHFWRENSLASAPLVATRRRVTDADWSRVESRMLESLRSAFPGRVEFVRNAWIAVGTRPKS